MGSSCPKDLMFHSLYKPDKFSNVNSISSDFHSVTMVEVPWVCQDFKKVGEAQSPNTKRFKDKAFWSSTGKSHTHRWEVKKQELLVERHPERLFGAAKKERSIEKRKVNKDTTWATEAPGPGKASTPGLPHRISLSLNGTGSYCSPQGSDWVFLLWHISGDFIGLWHCKWLALKVISPTPPSPHQVRCLPHNRDKWLPSLSFILSIGVK